MANGYCPRCGNACEVIFRPYKKDSDGKITYPKRAKVFVIPLCNNCR